MMRTRYGHNALIHLGRIAASRPMIATVRLQLCEHAKHKQNIKPSPAICLYYYIIFTRNV